MAFTLTHRFVTTVVGRLRDRRDLTAPQHIGRYPAPRPVAMVTASLGGHPRPLANSYR